VSEPRAVNNIGNDENEFCEQRDYNDSFRDHFNGT